MLLKKLDFTYTILTILFSISIVIIFYFYKMNQKITTYENYALQLEKLKVLDKEFDNFLLQKYTYNNYDSIASFIQEFDDTLNKLKTLNMHSDFSTEFETTVEDITQLYQKKSLQIEDYKAINSASINSLSYLFDLKSNIVKTKNIRAENKKVIENLTFEVMQLCLDVPLNNRALNLRINALQSEHKYIEFYVLHFKKFLTYNQEFHDNKQLLNNIKLYALISSAKNKLDTIYHTQMRENQYITILFFIGSLLMLLILIYTHYHSRKSSQILHLYASVFKDTQEGILITDAESSILFANRSLEILTGYTTKQMIGERPNIFQSHSYSPHYYAQMWEEIKKTGKWQGRIKNKKQDGTLYPVWLTISSITNDENQIVNYFATQTDIREIVQSQEKIEHIAYHDSLTGLDNRISFEEKFKQSLKISHRNQQKMALLFIDLDRFKDINDTLGHHIGDKLLLEVAQRLTAVLRETDLLARIGGDEFVIVLEDIAHKSNAAQISEKIIVALKEPFHIDQHELSTSASIGISFYPDDTDDFDDLLKFADSAMYKAKESGKDTFAFYDAKLYEKITHNLRLEHALKNALENNELYLNFQPQYALKDRAIISAEALVRWNTQEFGMVPPDVFIPLAENSGLIIEIGYFVFEASCQFLSKLRAQGHSIKYIAINLSSNQFKDTKLLKTFASILARYDLQASDIEIEITERYIMQDNDKNLLILQELQNQGYSISIDDFGTGYSSMSYLKTFPIDMIKIDKSFIDNLPTDLNDVAITKAILALSKSLGYDNVAEGIETIEQEQFLAQQGCKYGQGYHFSKPLNENDFINFIDNDTRKLI